MSKAYRGYLIHHSHLSDAWWITKDGQHISYASGEATARAIIDSLTS